MTTRLVTTSAGARVAAVREQLARAHPDGRDVDAVTVVDPTGRLVDDVPVFDLAVADGDAVMGALCDHHVARVAASTELVALLDEFVRSRRTSVVVVDPDGRPIGRVLADDLLDAIRPRPLGRLPGPRR